MKVGFIGLGKLGLPCAVAIAAKNHEVMGYDINPDLMNRNPRQYRETGPDGISPFNPFLEKSTVTFGKLEEVADFSDIIFVAVQTPHEYRYEGITRIPPDRVDFNYEYLERAVKDLSAVIKKEKVVVVISTVLPGTLRRRILPLIHPKIKLCYNPFFIAMGTTMRDFLHPEFVLFGVHDEGAARTAESFYRTITDAPFYKTTLENAELIKVSYNTFIGMKIVFANTLMEICHRIPGTNVDEVTNALKLSHRRLISGSYLSGGMGDGGGCHPRDNIAMSWLARDLNLSYDFFEDLMTAREMQTEWLADLMCEYKLPKAILGYSFKPETSITVGSPALLLKNILEEKGEEVFLFDPFVDKETVDIYKLEPMVFLIGTKHSIFTEYLFPPCSIVIDPWRYIDKKQSDVEVIPVGKC
jgi:UDPglucose 6-dehydrogenase